jgi:hypothetical protein
MPEMRRARPLVPPQGVAGRQDPDPQERPEGSDAVMIVTIPLVAIAGFVVYVAYRYMGMRVWHAIICAIFGFLLGDTTAAPQINHLIIALAQWLQRP